MIKLLLCLFGLHEFRTYSIRKIWDEKKGKRVQAVRRECMHCGKHRMDVY